MPATPVSTRRSVHNDVKNIASLLPCQPHQLTILSYLRLYPIQDPSVLWTSIFVGTCCRKNGGQWSTTVILHLHLELGLLAAEIRRFCFTKSTTFLGVRGLTLPFIPSIKQLQSLPWDQIGMMCSSWSRTENVQTKKAFQMCSMYLNAMAMMSTS